MSKEPQGMSARRPPRPEAGAPQGGPGARRPLAAYLVVALTLYPSLAFAASVLLGRAGGAAKAWGELLLALKAPSTLASLRFSLLQAGASTTPSLPHRGFPRGLLCRPIQIQSQALFPLPRRRTFLPPSHPRHTLIYSLLRKKRLAQRRFFPLRPGQRLRRVSLFLRGIGFYPCLL